MQQKQLPKESIIKLKSYQGKFIRVKFLGGREITGVLKSSDQYLNMILDDCLESIRSQDDPYVLTQEKRKLGLIIIRGNLVQCCYSMEGTIDIENPYLQDEQLQEDE